MHCLKTLPIHLLASRVCTVNLINNKRPAFESIRRGYPATYEGDGKTTATVINLESDIGLLIDSFSPHGFRLNNKLFVKGSMVLFPSTAFSWQVRNIKEANEASFSLFHLVEPKLDILVIGVGDKEDCTRETRQFLTTMMKKHNLPLEVLPTEAACSTYNFLAAENRFVGCALIPALKGYNMMTDVYEATEPFNMFT